MVALIKQIIKNEYEDFKFVSINGGDGSKRNPFQITIIHKGIDDLEIAGGMNGKLYEIVLCSALTMKIASEFIRHEINNFRLYMIPQA